MTEQLQGKGKLPEVCPVCKYSDPDDEETFDWSDFEETGCDNVVVRTSCPNCKTKFFESWECSTWHTDPIDLKITYKGRLKND